jgi:Peptidase propeptide and YPEB domain
MYKVRPSILVLLVGLLLLGGAACKGIDVARARGGEQGEGSQAQLAQQAHISQDQARAAAVASVPGTVQATRLDREGGQVVYEVTVQPQGGGQAVDVQVDGTNGNVLKTEPAGRYGADDNEGVDDDDG